MHVLDVCMFAMCAMFVCMCVCCACLCVCKDALHVMMCV